MHIKIVGSGCKNCKTLLSHTKEAVSQVNDAITIEYVTDMETIASMGLLRTPGFIMDDKVISAGKVLTVEEVKTYLLNNTK